MSERAKKRRRFKNNKALRAFRERQKQKNEAEKKSIQQLDMLDSMEEKEELNFVGKTRTQTVKVKLQFKKKKSSRKRISRAHAKAHKEIKEFQAENQGLQRKSWKMQRKVDRMNKHMRTTSTPITSSSDQSDPVSPSPRTLADKEIRLSGLTPRQVPKIRRRLLVANCITSKLRQAGKANSKQLGSLRNVIAGKIVKKYRVIKAVSMATGLNRRKMSLSCTKLITNFSRKRKIP